MKMATATTKTAPKLDADGNPIPRESDGVYRQPQREQKEEESDDDFEVVTEKKRV